MVAKRDDSEKRNRWRDRILTAVLALLPMLVGAGLLAPGVVRVIAISRRPVTEIQQPEPIFPVQLARSPLLLPLDFSVGFTPDLVDLDHLFFRTQYDASNSAMRLARMLAFPRSHGDVIVLDDVSRSVREIVFSESVVHQSLAWRAPGVVGSPYLGGGGSGGGSPFLPHKPNNIPDPPVIPEPGTGLLLAGGLAALGWSRRRQRQPTTS